MCFQEKLPLLSHSCIFLGSGTESDDLQAKKPAPAFIRNVTKLPEKRDVVMQTSSSHFSFFRITVSLFLDLRLTCCLIVLRPPASSSYAAAATKNHEEVLWMFLNTFEELADSEVGEVVDISLDSDLEAAVRQSSKSEHVKEDRGNS